MSFLRGSASKKKNEKLLSVSLFVPNDFGSDV